MAAPVSGANKENVFEPRPNDAVDYLKAKVLQLTQQIKGFDLFEPSPQRSLEVAPMQAQVAALNAQIAAISKQFL